MCKKMLSIISMLLVIAMLTNMLPVSASAASTDTYNEDEFPIAANGEGEEDAHIVEEIVSERTKYGKEYLLSNGLHMAAVYQDPVHFEQDGSWQEIDNTLVISASSYTNRAGVWDISLPQQLSKNNAVTITKDGYTLSFYMAGQLRSPGNLEVMAASVSTETFAVGGDRFSVQDSQTSSAQVQQIDLTEEKAAAKHPELITDKLQSQLRYDNVYSGTDIVYDLTSNTVKESIIMQAYSADLRGYRYTLNVGDMLPVLTEENEIHLYDKEGKEIIMVMPAPFLVDDAGEFSYDVDVSLSGTGSTYTLTYLLPKSWLSSAERQWPVILDPVIEADDSRSNIFDVSVYETYSGITYTSGVIDVGHNSAYGIMRGFLRYDVLPTLAPSDVIVEAEMRLMLANPYGTPRLIEVHKVLGSTPWMQDTITWEEQPDFDPSVEDFAIVSQEDAHYYWDVTDIVRGWYETGVNTGMMFKIEDAIENTTSTTSYRTQFYSCNYSIYNERTPALTITFRNNNGLESYWDYTSSSAGRAGVGYVNDYSGNLVWIRGDIGFGGNRMPVSISHIYNSNDAQNDSFGLGYGWRTNFNQKVYQWSQDSSYYVWEDSDGTALYFKKESTGIYKQEDNSKLILTVDAEEDYLYCITDENGNKSWFDDLGRLVKQENNQETKSSITITYIAVDSYKISTITDGAGRVYAFTYNDTGLLSQIQYEGSGSFEPVNVAFGYTGGNLTTVTDKDGEVSSYTYGSSNLLTSAQDIDGYKLVYGYNFTGTGNPSRVTSIKEYDGTTPGGEMTISYAHNQTTFRDINGTPDDPSDDNILIKQFNNWGNTRSVQDGEGRAQYAEYTTDTSPTGKGNQLRKSSKLQYTVCNLLDDTSFEDSTLWNAVSSAVTLTANNTQAYLGGKSMAVTRSAAGTASGAYSEAITAQAGQTYTFSAYVKTGTATAHLAINDGSTTVTSETLAANSDWTRLQVSYTAASTKNITAQLLTADAGTVYMDCVQLEQSPTASRYNIIQNGDFRNGAEDWIMSMYADEDETCVTADSAACPQLENTAFQIVGDPRVTLRIRQEVPISGVAGDTYVLAGWAKGDSARIDLDTEAAGPDTNIENRTFSLRGVFMYTDGTRGNFTFHFNPDAKDVWQFVSGVMVAEKDFSSIKIQGLFDYNVNSVVFDGIQFFKEEFGTTYTYNDDGKVVSVVDLQKQTTTYEYDVNDNLTGVNLPTGAKLTYTYDNYHNVLTATSAEGLVYEFTYDTWGNNTSVSIVSGGSKITSTASYSTDGNTLLSTTDALGNETLYGYNANTNVLEWVQYPKDNANTRTEYTYDSMYRMASAGLTTDTGLALSAQYTYENDLLTKLETPSTTYTFTYGDFSLRSSVKVGDTTLASYSYTDDRNFYLETLAYGNGDSVQYEYDQQGRVTKQTYEDASYVSYDYDNSGALATVYDSESGISTTYYYDLTDRMMRYVEKGTNYSHSVGYEYDTINNLTAMVETINGVKRTTSYAYDDDNRITSITNDLTDNGTDDGITETYSYDAYGRVVSKATKNGDTTILTETYTYVTTDDGKPTSQVLTHRTQGTNYDVTYTYAYDANGNITSVSDGTYTTSYEYDSANQLIRENNQQAGKTWTWSYDNAGNIQTESVFPYTVGDLNSSDRDYEYTYGNSQWKDLLTAWDGDELTYDSIGNLLYDHYENTYTWKNGRQLASYKEDGNENEDVFYFEYNADGLRTKAYNGYRTYSYVYNGSQLVQMTVDSNTLSFTYDASGTPQTVTYNGTTYFYATNLQGDVTAILDSTGTTVVSYTYDAWGNHTSGNNGTGTLASTLGKHNPLRYRGYVYDVESELYYLQSRYYNPELGRFISPDAYVATGQGMLGNNMFAYCNNNPVNRYDPSGRSSCFMYRGEHENPFSVLYMCMAIGSGGGGGGGGTSCMSSIVNSKQTGFSYSGEWCKTTNRGKYAVFTERALALDITGGTFSFVDGISLINAELTMLEGSYDFGHFDLTSKIGTAEVNTTVSWEKFDVGASASIWEPSATVRIGKFNFTFEVPIGTVGVSLRANPGELAFTAVSWGLSIAWEEVE